MRIVPAVATAVVPALIAPSIDKLCTLKGYRTGSTVLAAGPCVTDVTSSGLGIVTVSTLIDRVEA